MGKRSRASGRPARGPGPLPPGLFRDIVLAPDRDRIPEALPVVSWRDDDEPDFLGELRRRATFTTDLERRGHWHGRLAELDRAGIEPPRQRRRRREVIRRERWVAARPIVLAGAVLPPLHPGDAMRLGKRLGEAEGLAGWIGGSERALAGRFRVLDPAAGLFDPERDLARVVLAADGDGDSGAADLWAKVGRLSNHPDDASLRLRFSFGLEGEDDASSDERRHGLVCELAERLLPEARALAREPGLTEPLEALVDRQVRFSQHIAYWNAPGGGALFHHDAFADEEPMPDGGEPGQRGVCFVQLVGETAWLALSIDDLGTRVAEFVGHLAAGEMAWVRDELLPGDALGEVRELVAQRAGLMAELALPGCGSLGPLVNRGPEFTGFLADAGHAAILHAGDAIVLPNHGLARTAMHSVFCAAPRTTYGMSLAIRAPG